MMRLSWLVPLLALQACQKEPPALQPDAGILEAAGHQEPAPYPLTAKKLEAFLGYQRTLIGIYSALLGELAALEAKADAGATPGAKALSNSVPEVLDAVDRQAKAEELARREAGLLERDIDEISPLVAAVAAKRSLAKTLNYGDLLKQFEGMRAKLPAPEQAGVDKSLTELRTQKEKLDRLEEERRKYGDANVDLLLAREKELLGNWELLLSQRWSHR